jgi:hypothetical protein
VAKEAESQYVVSFCGLRSQKLVWRKWLWHWKPKFVMASVDVALEAKSCYGVSGCGLGSQKLLWCKFMWQKKPKVGVA